mgnify:CR=1 FL=1
MIVPNVRVERMEMTVEQLLNTFYIVDPDEAVLQGYQLEDFTYYIESLLIGTSVMPFVIGENPYLKGKDRPYEVVDGKKRFAILRKYLRGDFALTNCRFYKESSQRTFHELPRPLQRRLKDTHLQVFEVYECGFGILNYKAVCRSVRGEDNYRDM